MKATVKECFVFPKDREIVNSVIKAACECFEIDETTLFHAREYTICDIRHYCYYIIMRNTQLKDYAVGKMMGGKTRKTINEGVEKIDVHKKIYSQTCRNLNSIINTANNFDKKYPWHLQPID